MRKVTTGGGTSLKATVFNTLENDISRKLLGARGSQFKMFLVINQKMKSTYIFDFLITIAIGRTV